MPRNILFWSLHAGGRASFLGATSRKMFNISPDTLISQKYWIILTNQPFKEDREKLNKNMRNVQFHNNVHIISMFISKNRGPPKWRF